MTTRFIAPALATRVDTVPTGPDWLHEAKLDGYRIQCHVSSARTVLFSRGGHDWSDRFPELVRATRAVAARRPLILDGEVVMTSDEGRDSFQALQRALRDDTTARAVFWAFDLLLYDGLDLRALPLEERRAALSTLLARSATSSPIRLTTELTADPSTLLAAACAAAGEGVISKRRSSPYPSGRSREWLKIKCGQQDEFVVIGFSAPDGSRAHLGALLLASRTQGARTMRYAGRVGSGFDDATLRALASRLRISPNRPEGITGLPRSAHGVQWVEPALVVSVSYAEWPADGLLRHATFSGIREDKGMTEIGRETPGATSRTKTARAPKAVSSSVTVSSPARIVFPEVGATKLDVVGYYRSVAPLMLPHLAGRPLSLLRCPRGAHGQCFFQKHWPERGGTDVRTESVTEGDGSTDRYAVVSTAEDLERLAQQNVIEVHPWGSTHRNLERPDRIILDLDPGPGIRWPEVCDAAQQLRQLLMDIELSSWVKLTGGSGLHVTIPVGGRTTWEQATLFARLMAERLTHEFPKRFTSTMAKRARTGRIFIDWMRNSRGATAVAPWSLRARRGAPIAVPILWDELDGVPSGDLMSIADVSGFLRTSPSDPWQALLDARQRITTGMVATLGEYASA